MLKLLSAAGMCLLLATGAQATTVNFDGPYGSTATFEDNGGNGWYKDRSANYPGVDFLYRLKGSNSKSGDNIVTSLTFSGFSGVVELTTQWIYGTIDKYGPSNDLFGLIINGKKIQLSDDDGISLQGGKYEFTVTPSDTFSFYIDSLDDKYGKAVATIYGKGTDLAPIPLPAALPMAAAGLMLLGGLASRRKKRTLA